MRRRALSERGTIRTIVALELIGKHIPAMQPRSRQEFRVHRQRRRRADGIELALHQRQVHAEKVVGRHHVRVARAREADAFRRRVRTRAIDVFQVKLLFVRRIADGIERWPLWAGGRPFCGQHAMLHRRSGRGSLRHGAGLDRRRTIGIENRRTHRATKGERNGAYTFTVSMVSLS